MYLLMGRHQTKNDQWLLLKPLQKMHIALSRVFIPPVLEVILKCLQPTEFRTFTQYMGTMHREPVLYDYIGNGGDRGVETR